MDIKHCMVVDLERRGDKRMFLTEQIATISMNRNALWTVQFKSSSRLFHYNQARLLYLSNPETIDIEEKGLYIKNKHITDVSEVLRFTNGRYTFYHVTYNNGYYENFDGSDVYVTRTPIDKNDGSIWDYLCKQAAETGLRAEDKESILSIQYGLVDRMRDNVPLAQYLGDNTKLGKYRNPDLIYYPFGCNASQKAAVQAALTNQVSVIQGPPGTGKTQTILNIIANLLMVGKTVLVVSNNNSAVENVSEKLAGEGLGFIVAKLGSIKNKEAFIANQPELPDMRDWMTDEATMEKKVSDTLNIVTTGFDCQIRQAQLKAELDALLKELKYNDMLQQATSDCEWLRYKSSSKLISLLNLYRTMAENGQKVGLWFRLKWSFLLGIKMFSFLRAASCGIDFQ